MTKRQNRMLLVALLVLATTLVVYFSVKVFNENLLYFFSPTDVVNGKSPIGKSFRLGGLVVKDSVIKNGTKVDFMVTDNANTFSVSYEGILPDLFKEEQGVIAIGSLINGSFIATQILAKHDENYMPYEVAQTLKKPIP